MIKSLLMFMAGASFVVAVYSFMRSDELFIVLFALIFFASLYLSSKVKE